MLQTSPILPQPYLSLQFYGSFHNVGCHAGFTVFTPLGLIFSMAAPRLPSCFQYSM